VVRAPSCHRRRRLLALRAALRRWVLVASVWVSVACQDDPHCERGACPIGQRCVFASGLCEADPDANLAAMPQFSGAWSLVGMSGLRHAMVGYDVGRRSLAWVERDGSHTKVTWLAGPAAGQAQGAGESSAALVAASIRPLIACNVTPSRLVVVKSMIVAP